jgi:hypothetical protein
VFEGASIAVSTGSLWDRRCCDAVVEKRGFVLFSHAAVVAKCFEACGYGE